MWIIPTACDVKIDRYFSLGYLSGQLVFSF